MDLNTRRLRLIKCDLELLNTALEGNIALETYLNVAVTENWTEFGPRALQYAASKLIDANEAGWWTYLPIHKEDNRLIGSGGYKGKPTADGIVEIGYEIAIEYRNQGLATEFVGALLKNAFLNENVKEVIAHTLGHANPSTAVLTKCGFEKIEEIIDPDHGSIWKWRLKK